MEMKFFAFLSLFVSLVFTQDSPNVYWNSLSTDVTVGVPLVDDPTLIGGRIQIKVSFNGGKSYEEMGEIFTCLLYTSPSPRDATLSRMPSSA